MNNFTIYNSNAVKKDAKRIEQLKNIIHNNVPRQYRSKMNTLNEQYADVFALPNDRGTEYVNSIMIELCKDSGIDYRA